MGKERVVAVRESWNDSPAGYTVCWGSKYGFAINEQTVLEKRGQEIMTVCRPRLV